MARVHQRSPRLRLELVGFEVVLLCIFFAITAATLPIGGAVAVFIIALILQSWLFYQIGRVREKLDLPPRR